MHLTMADMVLVTLLLVAFPARNMMVSLTAQTRPKRSRAVRFRATLRDIGVLLATLAAIWLIEQRSLAALGLDVPPGHPGLIGLGVAIAAIATFVVTALRVQPRPLPAGFEGADMFPETRTEGFLYSAMGVVLGVGWELLYRGYLLWALVPLTGQVSAIILAAVAYGLAHGYKSNAQLAGSLAMALLFAIAYALTGSLWWLMLIHIAVPLIGWLTFQRMTRAAA